MKSLNIFLSKDKDAKIGDFGAALKIEEDTSVDVAKSGASSTLGLERTQSLNSKHNTSNLDTSKVHNASTNPMLMLEDELQKIEEEDFNEDFMLLSGGSQRGSKGPSGKGNSSESPSKEKRKVGTPFYLAPELWEDKECSKKSDIWALGVILYELCTLKYPFFAGTMEELQEKVLKEKYTPIPVTVSKQLSEVI